MREALALIAVLQVAIVAAPVPIAALQVAIVGAPALIAVRRVATAVVRVVVPQVVAVPQAAVVTWLRPATIILRHFYQMVRFS